jgi:predicted ATPase
MGQMPVIGVGAPLVGREAEIGVLRAELGRAFLGVTRCVLIGGEAGIGKTRLAAALADLAGQEDPAGRVVWGQCVDLGGDAMPYTPFLPVIRTLAAELGEEGLAGALGAGRGELARLLPELGSPAVGVESEVGRGRLFEAIARLLEHAAAGRPRVVVLEDLPWADASTRELTSFLVRTLDDARVLLLGRTDPGVAKDHRPRLGRRTHVVLLSVRHRFWDELWTCESPRPGRGRGLCQKRTLLRKSVTAARRKSRRQTMGTAVRRHAHP